MQLFQTSHAPKEAKIESCKSCSSAKVLCVWVMKLLHVAKKKKLSSSCCWVLLDAIAIASLVQKHWSDQQLYLKPTNLSLRRGDSDFLDLDTQSVLRFSCIIIKHGGIAENSPGKKTLWPLRQGEGTILKGTMALHHDLPSLITIWFIILQHMQVRENFLPSQCLRKMHFWKFIAGHSHLGVRSHQRGPD